MIYVEDHRSPSPAAFYSRSGGIWGVEKRIQPHSTGKIGIKYDDTFVHVYLL
jgi:hypothetical protein